MSSSLLKSISALDFLRLVFRGLSLAAGSQASFSSLALTMTMRILPETIPMHCYTLCDKKDATRDPDGPDERY
jgi:hypothetical protein